MAAGAALYYLRENRKAALPHIRDIIVYAAQSSIWPWTRPPAAIWRSPPAWPRGSGAGSLLGCLDRTGTAMGARRLKQWLSYPLVGLEPIRQRLDAVEELLESPELRDELVAHV